MSTKIYEAYRCRIKHVNLLIDTVREQMLAAVVARVKTLMSCNTLPADRDKFAEVMVQARKAALKPEKDFWDLGCGFNLWIGEDGYAYLIPIAAHALHLELKLGEPFQDYCYWNNTDEPDGMTRKQWKTRERHWDKLNLGVGVRSHNARRLYHNVVDQRPPHGYTDEFILQDLIFTKLEDKLGILTPPEKA